MKVYGFKEAEESIMELDNTPEAVMSFVKGHIMKAGITDELCIVYTEHLLCKEETKPNVAWIDNGEPVDVIYGNCFVCRFIGNNFTGIKESDIPVIKKILKK